MQPEHIGATICRHTWVSAKGKGFLAQAGYFTATPGQLASWAEGGTSFQMLKDQEELFLLIPGSTAAAWRVKPAQSQC